MKRFFRYLHRKWIVFLDRTGSAFSGEMLHMLRFQYTEILRLEAELERLSQQIDQRFDTLLDKVDVTPKKRSYTRRVKETITTIDESENGEGESTPEA